MAENQSLEWLGLGLTGYVTLLQDSESEAWFPQLSGATSGTRCLGAW